MLPDAPAPAGPFVEIPAESPSRQPFWGYVDLLLVAGLSLAAGVVIIILLAGVAFVIPSLRSDPAVFLLPLQLTVYGAIYLALFVVFRLRHGQPVLASLGWRRSSLNSVLAILGGALLAFLVSAIASLLHTPKVNSEMDKLMESPTTFVQVGLLAVTAAPFFEELLFRGFIQPLLSRTFGVIAGVVVTALLFGSLHAPEYAWAWQYAVAVSLAGAVFGGVRAYTNSIVPGTIMHACYNGVFVAAVLFPNTQNTNVSYSSSYSNHHRDH